MMDKSNRQFKLKEITYLLMVERPFKMKRSNGKTLFGNQRTIYVHICSLYWVINSQAYQRILLPIAILMAACILGLYTMWMVAMIREGENTEGNKIRPTSDEYWGTPDSDKDREDSSMEIVGFASGPLMNAYRDCSDYKQSFMTILQPQFYRMNGRSHCCKKDVPENCCFRLNLNIYATKIVWNIVLENSEDNNDFKCTEII